MYCECGYEKRYFKLKSLFDELKEENIKNKEELEKFRFGDQIVELQEENRKLKEEIESLKAKVPGNTRKVTYEQVIKIKELRSKGISYRKVAQEVGVSTCVVSRALNGVYDK